jgi:diguanylate cyclase (GGDEF)-like protein
MSGDVMIQEGVDVLSTPNAGWKTRRTAMAAAAVSLVVLFVSLPFAKVQLPAISAFIPIYESALIVNDLITAVLLFGQFVIMRTKAVAVLAGGYLYTALIAAMHMLTFPGLFSPTGLLGAGPQSTAWIYMFWHGGFPLFVIAYALLGHRPQAGTASDRRSVWNTGLVVAVVLGLAGAFTVLATAGSDLLPPIMQANRYTPMMLWVSGTTWGACIVALVVLWRTQTHSTLDIWLMVVLCVWICDVALSVVFNGGRYDLGFYVGRLFGLLAASFVLLVLLVENSFLYSRLAAANNALRRMATTDPLTGVANRRAFERVLEEEGRRALRNQSPLSLLMVDVDFFKRFNDAYGHLEGDACLRAVAEVLSGAVQRSGDHVARYGGEEFAILLPQSDREAATCVGQRLCDRVAALGIPHAHSSVASHITISVGIACYPDGADQAAGAHSMHELIGAADRALYAAKAAGRGRVWLASKS